MAGEVCAGSNAGERVFIGMFVRAAVGALLAFAFIMVMAEFLPSHG